MRHNALSRASRGFLQAHTASWQGYRRPLMRARPALFAVLVVLAACGDDDGGGSSARCESVSRATLDAIEAGLTVGGGGTLGRAQAVRSQDFEKVWMVAAEINGAGLGNDTVGVWATNDITGTSGVIYAVDAVAEEFSDWGADAGNKPTSSDDGVSEARGCL